MIAVRIGEALGVDKGFEIAFFGHARLVGWLQQIIESHDHVLRHAAGRRGWCRADAIVICPITAKGWPDFDGIGRKIFETHIARNSIPVDRVHDGLCNVAFVESGWSGIRDGRQCRGIVRIGTDESDGQRLSTRIEVLG